jgi:tRNA-uridine 2-sulfurtransferase
MSGGVDSSVAASLLLEQGHEVIGVFMRHGEHSPAVCASGVDEQRVGGGGACDAPDDRGGRADDRESELGRRSAPPQPPRSSLPVLGQRADHKQGCCTAGDALDARRVADRLDIPFYALNLQEEFGRIIDYFVDEYTAGRTPNPCVMCNNWIKFGKLFDYADSVGAEFVATGHYARLECGMRNAECGMSHSVSGGACSARSGDATALLRGVDEKKDQSYVLFGIAREHLGRMLLPVGEYQKPEIRRRAAELGLRVAEKKDSQEICFVTSGKHDDFIRARRTGDEDAAGEVVTTEGRVVGEHPGIERFTIGQRKGLGIAMGEPYFVVRIEPDTRRVVIGPKEALARQELTARDTNWLVDPPAEPFRCAAQIRYNSTAEPATAEVLPDNRLRVTFDNPRYGIAPGQAVVCYNGPRVLGGGWIE